MKIATPATLAAALEAGIEVAIEQGETYGSEKWREVVSHAIYAALPDAPQSASADALRAALRAAVAAIEIGDFLTWEGEVGNLHRVLDRERFTDAIYNALPWHLGARDAAEILRRSRQTDLAHAVDAELDAQDAAEAAAGEGGER